MPGSELPDAPRSRRVFYHKAKIINDLRPLIGIVKIPALCLRKMEGGRGSDFVAEPERGRQ